MSSHQYTFKKNDEYFTPSYAVLPILKYIPLGCIVWCPFDKEDSQFVKTLKDQGYNVVFSHIQDGGDFFDVEVPKCDCIVSNPPYSIKTEVFAHLYEIGKPFAMLINLQGIFDNIQRAEIFSKNEVEILYLNPRVSYSSPTLNQQSSVPFQSGYVCSGLLPKQIMFGKIDRKVKNLL